MELASFPEANTVLDPPPGISLDYCYAASVCCGCLEDGRQVVVSCWKPTAEEITEIQRTGRVWLTVWGTTMAPTAVTSKSPFE